MAHQIRRGAPATVRAARAADWDAIRALAREEDMGELADAGRTLVAEDADGLFLGFLRLTWADGVAYVNPVAVAPSARRMGAGRALMEEARRQAGALRLVARGRSVPFYEALGCRPVPWAAIAGAIAADCDGCDKRACAPVPMAWDEG